jgi:hypothetical protein
MAPEEARLNGGRAVEGAGAGVHPGPAAGQGYARGVGEDLVSVAGHQGVEARQRGERQGRVLQARLRCPRADPGMAERHHEVGAGRPEARDLLLRGVEDVARTHRTIEARRGPSGDLRGG